MRAGPFDMGKEYRGAIWDVALYFLPGCVGLVGMILVFQWYNDTFFLNLLKNYAVMSTILFVVAAYVAGHVLQALPKLLGSRADPLNRAATMRKTLPEESQRTRGGTSNLLRRKIIEHVLSGESEIIKDEPNEVFHLCVQFLRVHSPDLFDYYVSRQFWIAEMRVRLGLAFGWVALLSLPGAVRLHSSQPIITTLISSILAFIMIRDGYKTREFYVRSVLRAIYIATTSQNSGSGAQEPIPDTNGREKR